MPARAPATATEATGTGGNRGGCPFSPGATGNVATEDVVAALESAGEAVGVDRKTLTQARRLLDPFVTDDRRTVPEEDLPACAYCEYATGPVCCKRREVYG